MTDITSSRQFIQQEETDYRSSLSEALLQKVGGTVNWLIDERDTMTANIAANASAISALFNISDVSVNITSASGNPIYTCPANSMVWVDVLKENANISSTPGDGVQITATTAFATYQIGYIEDTGADYPVGVLLLPGDTLSWSNYGSGPIGGWGMAVKMKKVAFA